MEKVLRLEVATEADAESIRSLMVEVERDETSRWYEKDERPIIPGYNSINMQTYHTWNNNYYKIMYDAVLIGVILIAYTGREHGRIDRFYIKPNIQNKGIGSKVLGLIEAMYPMVKIWTLDTAQKSLRNHKFYEKNGYIKMGEDEQERYYQKLVNTSLKSTFKTQENSDLSNQNFRECRMDNIDVYDTSINNTTFTNVNSQSILFQNSNMTKSRFTNVNLSDTVFGDSKMTHVEICHVSLAGAFIHDTNLGWQGKKEPLRLERCELMESSISDSNLKNVSISNCNIEGMTIDGILVTELIQVYRDITNGKRDSTA